MSAVVLQYMALALLGAAIAAGVGALLARSLFAMCMHLGAASGAAAAAVLLLSSPAPAMSAGLVAAAWTPVLLLAAILLSARAAKPSPPSAILPGILIAAGAIVALCWPLGELNATAQAAPRGAPGLGFWLAPLIFIAGAACLALLGYGERGALTPGNEEA